MASLSLKPATKQRQENSSWGLGGIGTENNAKAKTIYPYGFQALNSGFSQAIKSM